MTGELMALGASHKTAPLALRELPCRTGARRAVAELVDHEAVHEAVAISTCNHPRGSVWSPSTRSKRRTPRWGSSRARSGLRPTELLGAIYSLRGAEAVETCSPSPGVSTR